jgi:hypothetical protein
LILVCAGTSSGAAPLTKSAESSPIAPAAVAPEAETKPAPKPASEKIVRALGTAMTVEFLDVPLSDAVSCLARHHSIAIRFDREALDAVSIEPAKKLVVLKLRGYPLRTVLHLLVESESLGFFVDGDELVITTRERADAHIDESIYDLADVVRGGVAPAVLGEAVIQSVAPGTWKEQAGDGQLRIEGTKLVVRHRTAVQRKVQRLLVDLQRALIAVPGVFEDDLLELRSYPVADLRKGISGDNLGAWISELLLVATPLENVGQTDVKIERDQLLLKQPPWVHAVMAKHLVAIRERSKRDSTRTLSRDDFTSINTGLAVEAQRQSVRNRLVQRLTVDFRDLPIEDTLTFLKEAGGIDVWLDRRAAKKGGIRWDKPVTLQAAKETLTNLFDLVLTPSGLDWRLLETGTTPEPGLIIVAPQTEGADAFGPRVYGIRELRQAGNTVEGLMSLLTNLNPGSWSPSGGPGVMRQLSPGLLIVNQTPRMHRQIDKLFDELAPNPQRPAK